MATSISWMRFRSCDVAAGHPGARSRYFRIGRLHRTEAVRDSQATDRQQLQISTSRSEDSSFKGPLSVPIGYSVPCVEAANAVLVIDVGRRAPMNPAARAQYHARLRFYPMRQGRIAPARRPSDAGDRCVQCCQVARSTVVDCAQAACRASSRAGERGSARACRPTSARIFSITGHSRMAAMIYSPPGSCRSRTTVDGRHRVSSEAPVS